MNLYSQVIIITKTNIGSIRSTSTFNKLMKEFRKTQPQTYTAQGTMQHSMFVGMVVFEIQKSPSESVRDVSQTFT